MMLATTAAPELVTLRGGLSVSLEALRLLWQLEAGGYHVRMAADGVGLLVSPRSRLSPDDDHAIRQHARELVELVRYTDQLLDDERPA